MSGYLDTPSKNHIHGKEPESLIEVDGELSPGSIFLEKMGSESNDDYIPKGVKAKTLTKMYKALLETGEVTKKNIKRNKAILLIWGKAFLELVNANRTVDLSPLEGILTDLNSRVQEITKSIQSNFQEPFDTEPFLEKYNLLLLEKDATSLRARASIKSELERIHATVNKMNKEIEIATKDSRDIIETIYLALIPVYEALAKNGYEDKLAQLEALLENYSETIRKETILALGRVYVSLIMNNKEVDLSLLEARIVTADVEEKSKEMRPPYLERDPNVRRMLVTALGEIYQILIEKGKSINLFLLEEMCHDYDSGVNAAADLFVAILKENLSRKPTVGSKESDAPSGSNSG
jgi:hypothetical protein